MPLIKNYLKKSDHLERVRIRIRNISTIFNREIIQHYIINLKISIIKNRIVYRRFYLNDEPNTTLINQNEPIYNSYYNKLVSKEERN